MTTAETRNVAVDFQGKLDEGELLTGTPNVVENPATDLVFSNQVVSTGPLDINGVIVPAGRAVQFRVTAGTRGSKTIDITVTTNRGQLVEGTLKLRVCE